MIVIQRTTLHINLRGRLVSVNIRDKYAFVGVGLTEQGKVPDLSVNELATEAVLLALADSGMRKNEIDGYIFQPGFGGGPVGNTPLWSAGIPSKFCWELQTGGATGISTVAAAVGAMEAGLCQACILLHATSASTLGVRVGAGGHHRSTFGAYGYYAPVAQAAAIARRWMHLYGLTKQQLGSVAVTLREYANKRPEAVMQGKRMTMDDYLNSRIVVEPLSVADCCLVNDGAVALIITSAERAKDCAKEPVYVMGYGLDHSGREIARSPEAIWHMDGFVTDMAGKTAFETAGVTVKDIDVAEIYDAFTIFLLSQLESYGICGKGEAGAFVEAGNLRLDGSLPSNTSGTELSWSYLQGFTHLTEGIRQMRGEGGECQVKDAEIAMVTGLGAAPEPALGSAAACCILRR
jgi:acetyl-CoA acetyltransferase